MSNNLNFPIVITAAPTGPDERPEIELNDGSKGPPPIITEDVVYSDADGRIVLYKKVVAEGSRPTGWTEFWLKGQAKAQDPVTKQLMDFPVTAPLTDVRTIQEAFLVWDTALAAISEQIQGQITEQARRKDLTMGAQVPDKIITSGKI